MSVEGADTAHGELLEVLVFEEVESVLVASAEDDDVDVLGDAAVLEVNFALADACA